MKQSIGRIDGDIILVTMKIVIVIFALVNLSLQDDEAPTSFQETLTRLQEVGASLSNLTQKFTQVSQLIKRLEEASSTNETAERFNEIHFQYRTMLGEVMHTHEIRVIKNCEGFLGEHEDESTVFPDILSLLSTARGKISKFKSEVEKIEDGRKKVILLPMDEKIRSLVENMRSFLELQSRLRLPQDYLSEAIYDLEQYLKG